MIAPGNHGYFRFAALCNTLGIVTAGEERLAYDECCTEIIAVAADYHVIARRGEAPTWQSPANIMYEENQQEDRIDCTIRKMV